jgi:tetratricopeptide (TPR) repeat protein
MEKKLRAWLTSEKPLGASGAGRNGRPFLLAHASGIGGARSVPEGNGAERNPAKPGPARSYYLKILCKCKIAVAQAAWIAEHSIVRKCAEILNSNRVFKQVLGRCLPRVFLLFSLLTLAGCGARGVYGEVIQGNYQYGRGRYQEAIVFYLRALEAEKYTEWIEYNLGNAYYSLGETEAAAAVWEQAGLTQDPALQFHIAYNKGCLFYPMGQYREAYQEFRQALRLEPSAVDAKINLELSLRKMNSGGAPPPPGKSGGQPAAEDPGRILDYVKRKEGTKWTAADEIDSSGGEDW